MDWGSRERPPADGRLGAVAGGVCKTTYRSRRGAARMLTTSWNQQAVCAGEGVDLSSVARGGWRSSKNGEFTSSPR